MDKRKSSYLYYIKFKILGKMWNWPNVVVKLGNFPMINGYKVNCKIDVMWQYVCFEHKIFIKHTIKFSSNNVILYLA